jgi:hypothetical protein
MVDKVAQCVTLSEHKSRDEEAFTMPRQKDTPAIPTVHEALDVLTIEQLKPLAAMLPTQERPPRKGELVALIEQYLSGNRLRALWEQLDPTQQLAVAETIHYEHGVFNAHRFRAKYGALPVFGTKKDSWGYGEIPSWLFAKIEASV